MEKIIKEIEWRVDAIHQMLDGIPEDKVNIYITMRDAKIKLKVYEEVLQIIRDYEKD